MTRDEIAAGSAVFRTAKPGALGVLTGDTREFGPQMVMAEVDWGTRLEFVDIRGLDLRRIDETSDMASRVAARRYGTIEDLRRRITYEKLQGTLTDVFYSMAAAKIDFLAYQFKPVLSFIESPTNRLLIADEVGLGKTIEAGLIWTEFQARHHGRRLLVICPPSLCLKWIRELRERFQIDAVPADCKTLLDWTDEFERKGAALRFAGVCSYHSLRPTKAEQAYLARRDPDRFRAVQRVYVPPEKIQETPRTRLIERILDWQDPSPFTDMVIFDEAHAMKNTATASHILGDIFSTASGATLCLSATPIHNESRDLYALLKLIDPDFFDEQYTYDLLRRRNMPVVALMNALSDHNGSVAQVCQAVNALSVAELFDDSPAVRTIQELAAGYDGSPEKRVGMLHHASRLNQLGSFINRTRKAQVLDRRVLRAPEALTVHLSSEEKQVYAAVLALIRRDVRQRGEVVTSFHLLSPALRMSSCIPTIVEDLRKGRWGGFDELELVAEDYQVDQDLMDELSRPVDTESLAWVRSHDFEANDTKYQVLRDDMVARVAEDKILIFAFFKDTIRYLHRRLTNDGFRVVAVTGDIQDRTLRDQLLRNFENDDHQILLCSEIGAEGIDLQFCRVMVNYDLPWNPMRVEQRIGRIDRIGQQAKRITIVNFNMLDTIDGRIYQHLYRKIEIFRTTLGDLEGIIGDEVSRLTTRLLSDELSPEEETAILEQTAQSILSRRKLEAELEDGKDALLAHSDYLAEQIGESHRLGRFVKPAELEMFVSDFFSANYKGSELNWDTPIERCGRLKLSFEAWHALQSFATSKNQPLPGASSRRGFYFTFDPDQWHGLRQRKTDAVLVNHLHPLIQWITTETSEEQNRLFNTTSIKLTHADGPYGPFFFLVRRLCLEGLLSKRETLHYAMVNLESNDPISEASAELLLNAAFENGQSLFSARDEDYAYVLHDLERSVNIKCAAAVQSYEDDMQAKLEMKKAKVQAHYARRLQYARKRLSTMESSAADRTQGIRLTKDQISHLEENMAQELHSFEHPPELQVTMDNVICGLMEVSAP